MKVVDEGDFWKYYSSNLVAPLIISKDMVVLNPDLLNEPYRVSIPIEPMKLSRLLNHRQIREYKDLFNFLSTMKFKLEEEEEKAKEQEKTEKIKPTYEPFVEKPIRYQPPPEPSSNISMDFVISILLRSMNKWRHLAILFLILFILTIILVCLEIIKR